MPGCDFPGCKKNSHAYDYYGDVTKKYSFHRVPDVQREKVADLISLPVEKRQKANLFICDSHILPGSFVLTDKKRKLRSDIPFCDLLILPGAGAVPSNDMDTSSFMTSFSDDSYISRNREPGEQEEQMQVTSRLSPAKKRKSNLSFRRSPKQQPSPVQNNQAQNTRTGSELSAQVDEIKLLMSGIASAELKALESERKFQELNASMNQTRTHLMNEADSKDKEIANLKKQLQQVIAENKALSEANKSLTVDLNVYRKLIQLESKSTVHPRSPSSSPARKHWRGMRESSIDVDLADDEPEESLTAVPNGQFKADSRGSLEEIKKWLKSSKKC